MESKKKKRKYKNNNMIIGIISLILCIFCSLVGFFIGNRFNSTASELESLKKSNIKQEDILSEKEKELSKIKKNLTKNNSTIKSLEEELSSFTTEDN